MRFPSFLSPTAHRVRRWRKRGQTLVEYALVLAVLTVVMIFCMRMLGARIIVVFSDITAVLDTAQSSH